MLKSKFELSTKFCMHNGVCILCSGQEKVVFGLLNLNDLLLQERLLKAARRFFGSCVGCEFVQVDGDELERCVSHRYGESADMEKCGHEDAGNEKDMIRQEERHAATILLDSLLKDARGRGATDIHIDENSVRFRVCGLLEKVCDLNLEKSYELIRKIKALAQLNLLESKCGQDGSFVVEGESPLFVRVSCVPSVSCGNKETCESVVLRLLDPAKVPLDFEMLGFNPVQCHDLRNFALLDCGLVLLCGPTGAGKSTTAASLLKNMSCDRKVISIEDPPEYVLANVTQIPVGKGLDYAEALKIVFRHDPDVIFIGEIRDEKSANIAVQAALTGHLVFATLHAGGFAEAFYRLCELGVDRSELKCALKGTVIQKLLHKNGKVSLSAQINVVGERKDDFSKWKNSLFMKKYRACV